ncbi:MAG TPA: FecR domain-containing protein [Methylomirabilota bacterium]
MAVVTTVQGAATVTRVGASSALPLQFRGDVYAGDRIETGDQSRVQLLLGGKALLSVRESSVVTIGERPSASVIELTAGTLAVATARDRLKVGEIVEVRTPDAIVQIRGTVFVAEVSADAATAAGVPSAAASRFTVLSDVVDVIPIAAGESAPPVVKLTAWQTLIVSKGTAPGQPSGLTNQNAGSLVSSLVIRAAPPPPYTPPTIPVPTDWTLLIDRGRGFEVWWGAADDGVVAGDGTLERTSLATCDAVARLLARDGARVACAQLRWRESPRRIHHRDTREHVLARGPLAGKLVVYEPGADAPDWKLIPLSGDSWGGTIHYWGLNRPDVLSGAAMELSTCYEQLMDRRRAAACVRLPPSSTPAEYRDASGRLMVEGPFAGDFVVHDPTPPPITH